MDKYSSIWEGKSIWDAEATDWVSSLLSQAEQEAEEMEQQQAQEEEDDDAFMNELLDDEEAQDSDTIVRSASQNLDGLYSPSSNSGSFSGIYKNEGARTGQPTNLNSSAVGRGQMIKGTRVAMYKKAGISDIEAAEQEYRSNPQFEEQINNLYREELDGRIPSNIQGKEREYMIAKGWYTGNPFYKDDVVPHPEAGNKMTAGEYARRATKNQYGGYSNIREENGEYVGDDENGEVVTINPMYLNSYGFKKNKFDFHLPSNYGMMSQPPIQLPEVEIKGKRNSNASQEDPTILSPIRDIFGAIVDEQSKVEDKKFLSNIPSDVYDLFKDVSTFAKNKANTAIDAINTGLDTTISYLGDQQNNENIAKANKWLADERYTPVRNSRNKKRAYI